MDDPDQIGFFDAENTAVGCACEGGSERRQLRSPQLQFLFGLSLGVAFFGSLCVLVSSFVKISPRVFRNNSVSRVHPLEYLPVATQDEMEKEPMRLVTMNHASRSAWTLVTSLNFWLILMLGTVLLYLIIQITEDFVEKKAPLEPFSPQNLLYLNYQIKKQPTDII